MVLRNTLTSSNGLKLEGHVLETGITQQRRGDTKERSGRCRFMRAGARKKERQTKGKLPDDEPALVLCMRCYCAFVAAVVKGTGTVGKTDSFQSPVTSGLVIARTHVLQSVDAGRGCY